MSLSLLFHFPIFFFRNSDCEYVGLLCLHVYHLICNHQSSFFHFILYSDLKHTYYLFIFQYISLYIYFPYFKGTSFLKSVFLGWQCSGKLFRASALQVVIRFWLSDLHPSPAFSLGVFLGQNQVSRSVSRSQGTEIDYQNINLSFSYPFTPTLL